MKVQKSRTFFRSAILVQPKWNLTHKIYATPFLVYNWQEHWEYYRKHNNLFPSYFDAFLLH